MLYQTRTTLQMRAERAVRAQFQQVDGDTSQNMFEGRARVARPPKALDELTTQLITSHLLPPKAVLPGLCARAPQSTTFLFLSGIEHRFARVPRRACRSRGGRRFEEYLLEQHGCQAA